MSGVELTQRLVGLGGLRDEGVDCSPQLHHFCAYPPEVDSSTSGHLIVDGSPLDSRTR